MCVEPTHSWSRRACLMACRARCLRSRPGCQRTAGSSAGTRAGTPRNEARLLVGDDDLAARVQGGERLSGPRSRLGECRGQFGAAVVRALTEYRARAARRPWTATRRPAAGGGRARPRRRGRRRDRGSRRRERPRRHRPTRESPVHQCSGPLISTGPGASSAVPIPFVPVAHSDQHDHGAMLLSRARCSVSLSPWTVRIRPAPSVTVMTPPRLSTSLAIDAAAPPSWANTISCSSVCSAEDSSARSEAGGALRLGSTWYCSRQRYQDVATSGRTPRTRSSPARNRSRAAVTAWYRSASVMRWRFAVWLMFERKVYLTPTTTLVKGRFSPRAHVHVPRSCPRVRAGPKQRLTHLRRARR